MPKSKQANAIAILNALDGWGEPAESTSVDLGDWLEEPLPLHEFCAQYLDVNPWTAQREDLETFLGQTREDVKRLFTQDPPSDYNCGILCYGKGCLGPDELLTDYGSGQTKTVKEWASDGRSLVVLSWDEDVQQYTLEKASPVYRKGVDRMYRITLEDGRWFLATANHRCLSPAGWLLVSDLQAGHSQVLAKPPCSNGQRPDSLPCSWPQLTKVLSVEALGDSEYYDLTVQNTHCYFDAQGILHHNSGKDTLASLSIVWFVHVLLCLRDPQSFLGLPPQEPIDIALASPTLRQTRRVIFTKLKNRLRTCSWLRSHLQRSEFGIKDVDHFLKKATEAADFIELPNVIRIHNLPLQSASAEGFNLLAFVVSEFAALESEAMGATAEALFNTFVTSARTRFRRAWKGFLTSFPRSINDPQEKLIEAHAEGRFPELFVVRRATWEVVPHLSYKDFETEFIRDPEGSWAKLGAKPRAATEAYFRSPELIIKHASGGPPELISRWTELEGDALLKACDRIPDPVIKRDIFGDIEVNEYGFPELQKWFRGKPGVNYLAHADLAISGDSAGFCIGHMETVVQPEGKELFLPTLDLQFRWKASHFGGTLKRIDWNDGPDAEVQVLQAEIDLRTITEFLIWLSRKRGFNLEQVTFDQFNSAESRQVLYQYGITAMNFSVDREQWVWPELKGLIYARNMQYRIGPVEFAELRKLEIRNGKVDCPRTKEGDGGSHKDIADCMAAVAGQLASMVANETDYVVLPDPDEAQEEKEGGEDAIALSEGWNEVQADLWEQFMGG